ncbi:hypothetical protein PVMG_05326, partial [Plasmodium vivax Mauritania I]
CIKIYTKYVEKCKTNYDIYFVELDKFSEIYNEYMRNNSPCKKLPKILSHLRGNNPKVILIPYIIISVTLFILFILYKFNININ